MLFRIVTIIVKELIQFRRDWILTAFILLAPALQLFLMARAVERGVSDQPIAILDRDHSRLSRQLVTRLDNSESLRVKLYIQDEAEMRRLLDLGRVRMAVIIPAGFAEGLSSSSGSPQQIQVVADATNALGAASAIGAAAEVAGLFSADLVAAYGRVVPEFIDFRTDVRFNPTLDFRDFSIPAQLGFITYQVTLAVASLGLARERELGTLEQLMVTPIRRIELAVGKGAPAIAIGGLNFVLMWAISLAVFDTPMNGSVLLLAALTLLFVVTVVSWGLVISAISRTQQQAILFVFILAMMEITFSGFIVPAENMPTILRAISRFAPLQHYLVIIRGIMLKGAGLGDLWLPTLALLGLCTGMGLVSMRFVARQLE